MSRNNIAAWFWNQPLVPVSCFSATALLRRYPPHFHVQPMILDKGDIKSRTETRSRAKKKRDGEREREGGRIQQSFNTIPHLAE